MNGGKLGVVSTQASISFLPASPFVVLPSSHARAREKFAQSESLEAALRAAVRGEVRFDAGSRAAYATDASNYRQVPIGLVIPLDAEDVVAAVAVCRRFGAPVLSRGGGTSLAGQGCNVAVLLDFSKYMNGMGEIDAVARTVRVQPGVVLDRLRDAAEVYNLTFAPDPATHSRCTLGGMIGNNSCGVHALMGGKTVDNIVALEVLLYDGTRMTVGATSAAELAAKVAAGGREGEIYAELQRIHAEYGAEVERRFPRIARRVSGYNLDELTEANGFNVARALVGSEGTCVVVLGATLRLVESPPFRVLLGLGYEDIFVAADAVPGLLKHPLIGLEGMDGLLLDALRSKQKLTRNLALLPEGRGFLLAEFGGYTPEAAMAQAIRLRDALGSTAQVRIYTSEEAARVWHIRESGLGATAFVPRADGKPAGTGWEGWEDAAVAPEKLGSYLRAIKALMAEYGYSCPMYGHFGQGCVHMRHNFDLESEAGILAFRSFVERAAEIVMEHGGSLSGEHGDGQARGALLPKMFGEKLMEGLRRFKRVWDPENRMNPGKLIDANEVHEDLRLGADYAPWQPKLHFAMESDGGSMASAALRCVGVGACRKTDAGTMCPSFMATGEEIHSTRGRAHLLWELMQGEVLDGGWQSPEVFDSLDLCLSCKACKSECPVSVDMATYKSEFLANHWAKRMRPLAHSAFGRIDVVARLANVVPFGPALVNVVNGLPGVGGLVKRALHIHEARTFPKFARGYTRTMDRTVDEAGKPGVILWADTFNNYFHPQTMAAAHRVLRAAGARVVVPRQHLCCGRPLYDFGMLDVAKRYLLKVLDAMEEMEDLPVVVLEPSCASVFRDELVNLLPHDARAKRLRDRTVLLSEYLVKFAPGYVPPKVKDEVLVHGHCHHKAVMGMEDEMTLLRQTGAEVRLLDAGCCGMAGPFGFEADKFAMSQRLGERVLLPAVRAARGRVVTDGFSCAEQVTQNGGVRPLHLAELLAEGLNE